MKSKWRAEDAMIALSDSLSAERSKWLERTAAAAREVRKELGPDDRDWNCSYCHRIVDHWKNECPRCLRTKAEAR